MKSLGMCQVLLRQVLRALPIQLHLPPGGAILRVCASSWTNTATGSNCMWQEQRFCVGFITSMWQEQRFCFNTVTRAKVLLPYSLRRSTREGFLENSCRREDYSSQCGKSEDFYPTLTSMWHCVLLLLLAAWILLLTPYSLRATIDRSGRR